jgi:transcriptional regulator with XRE-family HTH domain
MTSNVVASQNASKFNDYSDIGRALKDARESMELSLEDVMHAIRVRVKYLEALEQGDIAQIPSEVYARGYIKVYAQYLGYDSKELLNGMSKAQAKQNIHYLPPEKSERNSRITLVVVTACLAALALGAAWHLWEEKQEVDPPVVRPVPQQFSSLSMVMPEMSSRVCGVSDLDCNMVLGQLYGVSEESLPLNTILELSEPLSVWYSPL